MEKSAEFFQQAQAAGQGRDFSTGYQAEKERAPTLNDLRELTERFEDALDENRNKAYDFIRSREKDTLLKALAVFHNERTRARRAAARVVLFLAGAAALAHELARFIHLAK